MNINENNICIDFSKLDYIYNFKNLGQSKQRGKDIIFYYNNSNKNSLTNFKTRISNNSYSFTIKSYKIIYLFRIFETIQNLTLSQCKTKHIFESINF